MHSDILIGTTADMAARVERPRGLELRPITTDDIDDLAEVYYASYPRHLGAATIADAHVEMAATFAGEFGQLWIEASLVALDHASLVGSVQVVRRSPWDPELACPFVIELFVAPAARGDGVGRTLLATAAAVCRDAGHAEIALRTGQGTSPAAHGLYASLGMRRPT